MVRLFGIALVSIVFASSPVSGQPNYSFFEPVEPARKIQVMVHRGMAMAAPENSAAAIKMCAQDFCEWAEIDVRLTRDGRHVIIHDDTVDRTTNGMGQVANFTLDELKKLDAGAWFAQRFAGNRLMTLPEVLALAKGKINLYLDCKRIDPKRLVEEVIAAGMERQVIVYDSPEVLAKVKAFSQGAVPGMTKYHPKTMPFAAFIKNVAPAAVEIDADELNEELCQRFHAVGIKVQAKVLGEKWDNPRVWKQVIDAGADWLQTDDPAGILFYNARRTLGTFPVKIGAVCAVRKSFVLRDRQEVSKSSYPKRPRFSLGFWSLYIAKPRKSRFLPHAPLARGIHRDVYWEPAEGVRAAMRVTVTQPLFAWAMLEDSASLETVRRCLEAIPDALLLKGLRQARGHGRDDYPVSVLWGVAVLTPLLRHPSYDACLAELRRNPTLCRLLGVETEAQVPKHWNLSRFLDVLGHPAHLSAMRASFDAMVRRLATVVPDLGRRTAGDATALNARRGEAARQEAEAKLGLPQSGGGRKEYLDAEGKVERVVEWFGYKLHLLVDVRHELALAYWITDPAVGDNQMIAALLEQARANLPEGRIESLAYDKAADDEAVHRLLHKAGIKPVIENRALWKGEPERMLPGHTGRSNLVYDESGTIHCYDKVSMPMVRHRMAYVGHEVKRGTLKYRCPARQEGWSCPSDARCNGERSYGLVARIKSELDLRRFPPIPRMTKQFERLYKGRTAVERVNARFKLYWGADDGNVVGARRFHAMVGVVMLVHLALGTALAGKGRGTIKTLGGTRLSPIAHALNEQIQRERSEARGMDDGDTV